MCSMMTLWLASMMPRWKSASSCASSAGLRLPCAASILAKIAAMTLRSVSDPSAPRVRRRGLPCRAGRRGSRTPPRHGCGRARSAPRRRHCPARRPRRPPRRRAPRPGRASRSSATASRREGRDTPSRSESSRSAGRRSPGRSTPRRISSSICRTTAWDSFSDWTGWKGMGRSLELVRGYDRTRDCARAGRPRQGTVPVLRADQSPG